MSKYVHGLIISIALFLAFSPQKARACGYDYVSQGGTTMEFTVGGQQFFAYVGVNTWMTNLQGYNFGTVNTLTLSKLTSITWESCTNTVLDATFYFRIYASGATPGAFTAHPINDVINGGTGDYRMRTYSDNPNIDLLNGLTGGTTYFLECYYRSNVDIDGNLVGDAILKKDNAGVYYKCQFTKGGTGGGGLNITFSNKVNINCPGGSTGAVTAAATGGTTYTYLWSNGATTATITNVPAGTYTVTATSGPLTGSAATSITQPGPLSAGITSTDETSASANNGTATSAPTGGTSPYTYHWSTNAATAAITGLDVGTYNLTVTDSKSCTVTGSAVINTSTTVPTGYCASSGSAPWQDWIDNVTLGTLNNPSSKWTYSNFTTLSPPNLTAGDSYPISISASNGWFPYNEHWGVWIDFDRSGTFEAGEKVVTYSIPASASGSSSIVCNQIISVPPTALEGVTRMRVSIKRDGAPGPCEAIVNGEVEDYNVRINPATGTCTMNASVSAVTCDNNGTDTNPADDRFSFSMNVTQTPLPGTAWSTTIGTANFSGTYGTAKAMSFFPISGGPLSFVVKDNGDPLNCKKTVVVTPPATCSNNVPCNISTAVTAVACDNNGTTGTGADDTFTFTLNVNGTGTGTGWTALIGTTTVTGQYNSPKVIGPYPISGGALNFTVKDAAQATCTSPITVQPPSPCSVTGGPTGYCAAGGVFPWEEWISKVQVAGINNSTGKWTYTDYTGLVGTMIPGQSYPVSLGASVSWAFNPLYFRVFIDWNRNGTFDAATETAFSGNLPTGPISAVDALVNGNISVPATASLGATRMRVTMKRGAYATACETTIPYGEVEDYTINIASSLVGGGDTTASRSLAQIEARADGLGNIRLQAAVESSQQVDFLSIDRSADGVFFTPIKVWENAYLPENQLVTISELDDAPAAGLNFYRLTTVLRNGTTAFSEIKMVDLSPVPTFTVFPNPTTGRAYIDASAFAGEEVSVKIIHPTGRLLFSNMMEPEAGQPLELDLSGLPPGELFIFLQDEKHRPVSKKLLLVQE